jgi:hypothetical protein
MGHRRMILTGTFLQSWNCSLSLSVLICKMEIANRLKGSSERWMRKGYNDSG